MDITIIFFWMAAGAVVGTIIEHTAGFLAEAVFAAQGKHQKKASEKRHPDDENTQQKGRLTDNG